jgi:hypothetical protein
MSDQLTAAALVRLATGTHLRASRMRRSGGLLGWWRERGFMTSIDEFAHAVRSVPQSEIATAPVDTIREIGTMVDAIVDDVEQFISSHRTVSLKRVERDRHLVSRIYELRASFEKIARRVTAQPAMTDLRWKVKIDAAHRDDPR